MLMNRFLRFRSLLVTLLTFCLLNASLWSYGSEVMADLLSDETSVVVIGANASDHEHAEKFCNHGCHAQIQLTGLNSSGISFSLADVTVIPSAEGFVVIPTQPHDGPFRPPRNLFQA